jgi:ribosomal-protein-alanine N-acetyltransferase
MSPADVERVMEIARNLNDAPHWPLAAYLAALGQDAPQSQPRRIALVAAEPETGVVAGFLVAGLQPPQAELETIAVAAEGQRRGVGRRLLAALIAMLKTAQVTEVILEVRASNHAALGFYRTLGFVKAGRRPRYYANPEEDAVLLELRLA